MVFLLLQSEEKRELQFVGGLADGSVASFTGHVDLGGREEGWTAAFGRLLLMVLHHKLQGT